MRVLWLALIGFCLHYKSTAVQKSCIHASAVAVFVEWWILVFVDIVSFHRGICTLGAFIITGPPSEPVGLSSELSPVTGVLVLSWSLPWTPDK